MADKFNTHNVHIHLLTPYIAHFWGEEGFSLSLESFVYLTHLCPFWDSDSSWVLVWKVHRVIIQLNINILLSCCKIAFQLACDNCCKHQDLRDGAEFPLKQRFWFKPSSDFIGGTWHHMYTNFTRCTKYLFPTVLLQKRSFPLLSCFLQGKGQVLVLKVLPVFKP